MGQSSGPAAAAAADKGAHALSTSLLRGRARCRIYLWASSARRRGRNSLAGSVPWQYHAIPSCARADCGARPSGLRHDCTHVTWCRSPPLAWAPPAPRPPPPAPPVAVGADDCGAGRCTGSRACPPPLRPPSASPSSSVQIQPLLACDQPAHGRRVETAMAGRSRLERKRGRLPRLGGVCAQLDLGENRN